VEKKTRGGVVLKKGQTGVRWQEEMLGVYARAEGISTIEERARNRFWGGRQERSRRWGMRRTDEETSAREE